MTEPNPEPNAASGAALSSPRARLTVVAVVLAIVLLAFVWRRGRSSGEPPLPDFTLQSFGGASSSRAGDARLPNALQADGNARIEVKVTADAPITGSVEVRVMLERETGDVVVPAEVTNAGAGAYRVVVPGAAVAGSPLGEAQIVAFVAHAGVLPDDAAAMRALESSRDVRVLRQPIKIVAPRR